MRTTDCTRGTNRDDGTHVDRLNGPEPCGPAVAPARQFSAGQRIAPEPVNAEDAPTDHPADPEA